MSQNGTTDKRNSGISVYRLFRRGKTTFIQETLEDPQFNDGQKTLILLCEEGETELSPIKFAASGCKIVTVDEEEQLTESYLADLQEKLQFERVVVEYNGMWLLDTFYSAMPPSWDGLSGDDLRRRADLSDLQREYAQSDRR